MPDTPDLGAHVFATLVADLRRLEALGARALAQVPSDEALNHCLDPESNSITVIVRHVVGNMRSRWTDFLTADGEKPTRNREGEFDQAATLTREQAQAEWQAGWACVFGALEPLTGADLLRTVTIRGEGLTVMEAISRQVAHYGQHVGQILLLAKHLAGPSWRSLSIPRGQSTQQAWSYKGYGQPGGPPAPGR
jgi:hypothetical protein